VELAIGHKMYRRKNMTSPHPRLKHTAIRHPSVAYISFYKRVWLETNCHYCNLRHRTQVWTASPQELDCYKWPLTALTA
jgi:hypothetical protein